MNEKNRERKMERGTMKTSVNKYRQMHESPWRIPRITNDYNRCGQVI